MTRPRVILGTWGDSRPRHDDAIRLDFRCLRIDRGEVVVSFSPMKFRFMAFILARSGPASIDETINALWGDRADGGVDDPIGYLNVTRCQLRPRLEPLGIVIRTIWRQGMEAVVNDCLTIRSPSVLTVAA